MKWKEGNGCGLMNDWQRVKIPLNRSSVNHFISQHVQSIDGSAVALEPIDWTGWWVDTLRTSERSSRNWYLSAMLSRRQLTTSRSIPWFLCQTRGFSPPSNTQGNDGWKNRSVLGKKCSGISCVMLCWMIGRLTQHEAGTQVNLPTVLKYPPTRISTMEESHGGKALA